MDIVCVFFLKVSRGEIDLNDEGHCGTSNSATSSLPARSGNQQELANYIMKYIDVPPKTMYGSSKLLKC